LVFFNRRDGSVLLELLLNFLERNIFVALLLFFLEVDLELQVGNYVLLDVVFICTSLGVQFIIKYLQLS
jgi:hypothetical protein